MIKINHQLLLTVKLVLFYVVGGIIYFKSPFKSFLEEISNCLYFYYSTFLIFVFLLLHIWSMILCRE